MSLKTRKPTATRACSGIDESLIEPPPLRRAGQRAIEALRGGTPGILAVDVRSLALFRAVLAGILFIQLCLWLGEAGAFLSDAGVFPRATLDGAGSLWRVSLHAANGQTGFEVALLLLALIAAAALFLGWSTRLAAAGSFILYVSLLNRVPQLVLGADMLLAALLLWCCFLPVNARWSLDRALADDGDPPPSNPQRSSQRCWATAALLIQGALACLLATWLALGADPLGQMLSQPAYLTPVGAWLVHHGLFSGWTHTAVRWVGGIAPLLLFTPVLHKSLKGTAWVLLVLLQIAAIFSFKLGPAPWVALAALAPFVGPSVWERLKTATGNAPLKIYYNGQRPAARRWQRLWCIMLILPHARLHAAQDETRTATLFAANNSWIVIDADDRAHLGAAAWLALLRRSPLCGPLGRLLVAIHADKALNRLFEYLGRHPLKLPASHALTGIRRPAAPRSAAVLLILVLIWNLGTLGILPTLTHTLLAPPLRLLRLDQHWARYLPRGPTTHGWLAAVGITASGTQVDALRGHGKINFTPPHDVASRQGNIRWHTWADRLVSEAMHHRARAMPATCAGTGTATTPLRRSSPYSSFISSRTSPATATSPRSQARWNNRCCGAVRASLAHQRHTQAPIPPAGQVRRCPLHCRN
ncbi:MAG: HTTM domain-containing protein, partial [Sinobacteraceae bacterium]|nr:HTTM domain-containing protein [Nevskiaceae bacterium]